MIVKLTINVPDELRRRARAIAALRGETVSDVVRAALENYVEESEGSLLASEGPYLQEGDALFNIIGLSQGGPRDLSSDKYAYFTEAFN